jgi:chromosome segregation ATPase
MNAAVAEVMNMVVEDRIARLESDVAEIKGDVKTLGKQFGDFKTEMAKEFSSIRTELQGSKTEVAKEFSSVRTELQGFKTEVAKEFSSIKAELQGSKTEMTKEFGSVAKEIGSVRIEMESLRTSIERNKVWMLCTGLSTVLSIAAIVGFK